MNKAYGRIDWQNYPSDETPINESNLNKIDVATDEIDNRVIKLDTTKATKAEVSTLVQDVEFKEKTGIITFTKKNGSKITIDTQIEKIAVNFSYNAGTQQIILTLIDGTKQYIDLAALITQYEFLDSDTVAFSIDSTGKVSAIVKEASIQEKHLQPNYLADIKVEVAKAQANQSAAAKSESNAKASETAAAASESNAAASATKAQSYAVGGTNSRTGEDTDNAKYYSQQAEQSHLAAKNSADTASIKAGEATTSANTAQQYASNSAESANVANEKANSAANSAIGATSSANTAQQYASNAAISASTAQNYAVADTDSAKYYYEQARRISESFSGALRPMGTVTFANLPALSATTSGNMYNISYQLTTTSDFKEGAGNVIPAGANVYKTEDGKWDVLAGTPVTGVKGSAESGYRRGNVNITAENVGAVPLGGNAGSADRAARLGRNGNAGYPMTFNWAGKTGQPSWLWGGENGEDMYVYNPSNFSVNYAASAGNAAKVNGHTVNSDVPSGAKFTDTNTWRPLGTGGDDACAGNDSRLSNARPASDVYAWAKASAKPTYNKAEVGLGNVDNTADSVKSVNYATSAGNAAKVNGHSVNADVPSNAKFTDTDTKGTCLSGRSSAYGWSVNRLSSGYLIEAFHTAAQNYTMTNQYGNMYWASFEITIPQSNNIKFFDAINITPYATSGLISVSITNYTTSKIQGFVFSPLAETKSISFHVTLYGTAS
ncbi:MAG: hypothetical protein HP021_07675 [Lachnospira sp.]|nr:hypothetical protein [Lachnospira sp.]